MSGPKHTRPWPAVAAVTLAVAGMGGLTLLSRNAPASAALIPAPAPSFIAGNVTTCAAAGLSGTLLFGQNPPDNTYPAPPQTAGTGVVTDTTTLDVTVNAGFTLSGIVVKGGPNTNVYVGPFVGPIVIEDMVSPPNPGGQIPAISHWFVCGTGAPPTTPPPTTPPPTTPPPTTPPPTTAPPTTAPPTATVVPSGGAETGGGGSQGIALAGAAALTLGAGAGLTLLWLRRRNDIA